MGDTCRSEAAADLRRFETKKTDSTDSDTQSTKTLHTITETNTKTQQADTVSAIAQPELGKTNDGARLEVPASEPAAPSDSLNKPPNPTEELPQVPLSSTSWLSWLSRPAPQGQSQAASDSTEEIQMASETTQSKQSEDLQVQTPPPEPPNPTKLSTPWFGLWTSSSVSPTAHQSSGQEPMNGDAKVEESKTKGGGDVVMEEDLTPSVPAPAASQPSAGSTWAFWSRDTATQKGGENIPSSEQGELAVIGDGSETNPRRSSVEVHGDSSNKKELPIKSSTEQLSKGTPSKKNKRGRPQSIDIDEPSTARSYTPTSDVAIKHLPAKSITATTQKALPRNLLLPSFRSTYRMKENPSIIKQITQLLLRTQQPPANHVFKSKETPRVKKAIAIGVHGLFPASYLRPMIGQPTGTSIRFANHCAVAIRRWADSNGSGECEIEKVALEGEGKIAERVDNLWKLLLNWIEQIKNADLIVLACHSQGVPVGVMLLAKLIELGVITSSRVGVCAMAGVSLGPFPDYKSGMGILMGSAAELWQFADPASEVSKRYEHALKVVIDHGVRITVSYPPHIHSFIHSIKPRPRTRY
jgi:hypothetical protein